MKYLEISWVGTAEIEENGYDERLFSKRRIEALSEIKNERTKKLSICAELALIEVLRKAQLKGEIPECELASFLEISEDPKGRPYFSEGSPLFGKAFFNLSHSEDYAVAALSDIPVGIDTEFTGRKAPKQAEKILNPQEALEYNALKTDAEKNKFFFENWVRKESYLKRLGIGLAIFPKNLEIRNGLMRKIGGGLQELETKLTEAPEGYIASICI